MLLGMVASACGGDPVSYESDVDAPETSATTAPPSFLDEPPAPPSSDTMILSGGTLIDGEDLFDAVVVVEGARVIAAGKRGAVPVPPDSIGIDASGKFIVAVNPDETLIGGPADLVIYEAHPVLAKPAPVYARVVAGEWQLERTAASVE